MTHSPQGTRHTSISIAAKVPGPLHERATLKLSTRDRKAPDGAQHTCVAQLRLGRDDRVGDGVVDRAVLLLLDLQHCAVLERPLDDVGFLAGTLDKLAALECGVPFAKVLTGLIY